jgi:YgiT-type zinc finger domain-containing protein
MNLDVWNETMVERKMTYTLEVDDKFVIVENVPARVCVETGEQVFSRKRWQLAGSRMSTSVGK